MDYRTYVWMKWMVILAVIIIIGLGIWQHSVLPVLLSTGLGIVGLLILRSRTNAVLVDERIEKIADRASRGAFTLSVLIFALVSMAFLVFTRRGMFFPEAIGTLFGYVAICMLALYLLLYWVYSRQMGGDSEKQN